MSQDRLSAEEVKNVLEIVASTGNFWHDWNELKRMLSFQLKQVLSQYPDEMKGDGQQKSVSSESFGELTKRLEEALCSFMEGPPFTLQRFCEILLDARAIYPNLSKLALALEKNLLVTSTLSKCTDPYPPSTLQKPEVQVQLVEDAEPQHHLNSVENGREPIPVDRDEVMSEAETHVEDGVDH